MACGKQNFSSAEHSPFTIVKSKGRQKVLSVAA